MKFEPVVKNPDLDILEAPEGAWARVVVVGLWRDKKAIRKRWPFASCVGPLRTVRGLDLLVRNLLANPQIRVVVVDGPDLSENKSTSAALGALFKGDAAKGNIPAIWEELKADDHRRTTCEEAHCALEALEAIIDGLVHLCVATDWGGKGENHDALTWMGLNADEWVDRPGGRHVLPPPAPKAGAPVPIGDPGQRVVGDSIADVWPQVLREAMRAGREVPTQYGMTREVLALTSVIRNPTIDGAGPSDEYYRQISGEDPPEGRDYSYGSRLKGGIPYANGDFADNSKLWCSFECSKCPSGYTTFEALCSNELLREEIDTGTVSCPRGHKMAWINLRSTVPCTHAGYPQALPDLNQFEKVGELLSSSPQTRAAYLTPWRPNEDVGMEGGRPCLVGLWFRAVPDTGPEVVFPGRGTLHLVVAFRSHDLFAAYTMNLRALCMLLVNTAIEQSMGIGTLTCHSYSAHVYDRDWNAANEAIAAWEESSKGQIDFDPRSSWHVEVVSFEWDAEGFGVPAERRTIRATALTPDGARVLAVFEGRTALGLRVQIERSALVTSVGGALWLGDQLAQAEKRL